ncbi:DUF4328 domain-containing protein [Nocardia terpenica]|uniref:DUF4328 domain-containing protein n=1 Tax=Nocardia terpenica TaxID=455432 RepID=UPI001895DC43|nr:DUF4328 domain-containing protein [Nocardia terpenica]MBF6065129.1 DUF4328 domain-containing protein [Nocardia terpenica]MBF6108186.1 DUF4328 domain-containing protein [Nocardia terpenica]MBF6115401.1 DUF4328 domain-containing protein [Nocardia terpenica]MBF6122723.1 DUF4328 domain-containing protein [Nocardia terpenica]MBF6157243.1 DUF4328 domain-containing protein [Nocardia terpenica]
MSTVVQPCARCGARWAVQGRPLHWCPRCRGVLLSPAAVDAPAERRNYRWVARSPGHRARAARAAQAATAAATPRYREIPRWGLRDLPPQPAPVARQRFSSLTERVAGLLTATAAVFAVAAVAELGRYLILMYNRTRLVDPTLLFVSDFTVYFAAGLALALALLSAIALAGWLIRARAAAYQAAGRHEPRSITALLCGCLIPGVNLLWPGVFLAELVRARGGDPRMLRAVRIWWCAWILDGVLVVAALCWRAADSLQVRADGVLFAVYTDLAAAAVAVLSLWVMRQCEGLDLRGRLRAPKRWVAAAGPIVPVIEPVHPVPETAERARDSVVGKDEGTPHESDVRQQEEVMAQ